MTGWPRLLLAGLITIAAGCTVERLGLDRECELNSDCQELLICSGGRCQAQCVEARDCMVGLLCVPSGTAGLDVCVPPETPARCAFTSECPFRTLCLEGTCHAECVEDRDCPGTSVCADGTCDSPVTLDLDAGFSPPLLDGEVHPCSGNRDLCGDVCVDRSMSVVHCGTCGNACAAPLVCRNGGCTCELPYLECDGECIDPRIDSNHCGECFATCMGVCNEAECCGAGRASCGGTCIDVSSDVENCGGCGRRCSDEQECAFSRCVPGNQSCSEAFDLTLRPGSATVVRGTTVGTIFWHFAGCGGAGIGDVFYTFELTERSLVYIRGTGTGIGFGVQAAGCESVGTTCSGRICAAPDAADVTDGLFELDAGRHGLIVHAGTGAGARGSAFSLYLEVVPIDAASVSSLPAGSFTVRDRIAAGPSTFGSCAPGGERAYPWIACDTALAGTLDVTVTGGASVGVASGVRAGLACGLGTISVPVAAGPGLHVLFVDAPDAASSLTYDLSGSRP